MTQTIPETRSHHHLVLVNSTALDMYHLSQDELHTRVVISGIKDSKPVTEALDVTVGHYVAAVYDGQWYIRMVTERSFEHNNVMSTFMSKTDEPTHFSGQCAKMSVLSSFQTYCVLCQYLLSQAVQFVSINYQLKL